MRPASAAVPDPATAAFADRLRCPWRVLHTGTAGGAWNMALDVALLQEAARERIPPTLRFYGWDPPTVSLGRFQDPQRVNLRYASERGWDTVRRPTGGRGVLHHHELTYSLVLPPSVVAGAGVRTSYSVLVLYLNQGLRKLIPTAAGVRTGASETCDAANNRAANCFSLASECDSLVSGGKLVGSAQVRRDGALLQHGSILLDAEPDAWECLFGQAGRMATLRGLLGTAVHPDRVAAVVLEGFAALASEIAPDTLQPAEAEAATRCAERFRI